MEHLRAPQLVRDAARSGDATAYVRATWGLHAAIARCSPHHLLRSIYLGLLEMVASHTRAAVASPDLPLDEYVAQRLELHAELVEAITARDGARTAEVVARDSLLESTPPR